MSTDKPLEAMWRDFMEFICKDAVNLPSSDEIETYRRYFYLGADAAASALLGPPQGMSEKDLGTPEWRVAKKAQVVAITDEVVAFRKASGIDKLDEAMEELRHANR